MQVAERVSAGLVNTPVDAPTKSIPQIIAGNLFTYFNMIFAALSVCIILVGEWRELLFLPVIVLNSVIGIFQEIRAKLTLDKLSLISAPQSVVIRDSGETSVATRDLVQDDVVILKAGQQICADAIIIDGEILVNESLITGEADEILKTEGTELLSGSYVVSGTCKARLERVGADSFVSRLTLDVKASRKLVRSEMMKSLSRLVMVIGILIIPIGAGLFWHQYSVLRQELNESVVKTVAALVGMIPEGLYLLTSVALAVSVVRLAQKETLVHELGCIETLARVNMLCVDKTGTITEPTMLVEEILPLSSVNLTLSDERISEILRDHCFNLGDENETMKALRKNVNAKMLHSGKARKAVHTLPFNSKNKFSAVLYDDGSCYLLGAPEFILGESFEAASGYTSKGLRVLMLAMAQDMDNLDKVEPLALITMSNKIRRNAEATFKYFAEQGVEIKVISGDNPETVSFIAQKAGIEKAEKYIDATELDTLEALKSASSMYTVFGRVTPEQKRELILAMKSEGNTVAMTGDGVNDVLALKAADCSIAMASGSEVAAQVSHLVLLNNDFGSMPGIVAEGRKVINNIGRSASLFLVKNIFSFLFAILAILAGFSFPVSPAQMSLVSTLTIGLPSCVLALEPNVSIVKGHFLRGVLFRAAPGGLAAVFIALCVTLFNLTFAEFAQAATVCAILLAINGFAVIFRVCQPFTLLRKILCGFVAIALILCTTIFAPLFALEPLGLPDLLIMCTLALICYPATEVCSRIMDKLLKIYEKGITICFHK
jgi:cation-transporting ATPase E